MLISNILNDSFDIISKQFRSYCWHFRQNFDQIQRGELINMLQEQQFDRLASKIKYLNQNTSGDCLQQISKLLFEHCLAKNRRQQLIQLIESKLVNINVRLDNYDRTLLHRSAYNLDVELVRILIEQGVNIRLRDHAGNTALHTAIQSYRNGAVIYGDWPDVVQNLTSIIKLLLEADQARNNGEYIKQKLETDSPKSDTIKRSTYCLVTTQYGKESTFPTQSFVTKPGATNGGKSDCFKESNNHSSANQESNGQPDDLTEKINPILLEDMSSPLVNIKNAFGRTALHYCVLVVGEQHLAHFVQLLISYGADTDATDTRMKTPLYCLIKRPGVSTIKQKCLSITHLLESGCDDLGLAIEPREYFINELSDNLELDTSKILQSTNLDSQTDPIFLHSTFKRVPHLKHLARLCLIRLHDEKSQLKRQCEIALPSNVPATLNLYINRRILDQSELF